MKFEIFDEIYINKGMFENCEGIILAKKKNDTYEIQIFFEHFKEWKNTFEETMNNLKNQETSSARIIISEKFIELAGGIKHEIIGF